MGIKPAYLVPCIGHQFRLLEKKRKKDNFEDSYFRLICDIQVFQSEKKILWLLIHKKPKCVLGWEGAGNLDERDTSKYVPFQFQKIMKYVFNCPSVSSFITTLWIASLLKANGILD